MKSGLFLLLILGASLQLDVRLTNNAAAGRLFVSPVNDAAILKRPSFFSDRFKLEKSATYRLDDLKEGDRIERVEVWLRPGKNGFFVMGFDQGENDFLQFRLSAFEKTPTGLERFTADGLIESAADAERNLPPKKLAKAEAAFDEKEAKATLNGEPLPPLKIDRRPTGLLIASGPNKIQVRRLIVEGVRKGGSPFRIDENFQIHRRRDGIAYGVAGWRIFGAMAGQLFLWAAFLKISCRLTWQNTAERFAGWCAPGCIFLLPTLIPGLPIFLFVVMALSAAAPLALNGRSLFYERNRWFACSASERAKSHDGAAIQKRRTLALWLLALFAGASAADLPICSALRLNPEDAVKGETVFEKSGPFELIPGAGLELRQKALYSQAIRFEFKGPDDAPLDVRYGWATAKGDPWILHFPYYKGLIVAPQNDPPLLLQRVKSHKIETIPLVHSTGSLHSGEWNKAEILVHGDIAEVWLNGARSGGDATRKMGQPPGAAAIFAAKRPVMLRNVQWIDLTKESARRRPLFILRQIVSAAAASAAVGLLALLIAWALRIWHGVEGAESAKKGALVVFPIALFGTLPMAICRPFPRFGCESDFLALFIFGIFLSWAFLGALRRTNGWGGGAIVRLTRGIALSALLLQGAAFAAPASASLLLKSWDANISSANLMWMFDPAVRAHNEYFNAQRLRGRRPAARKGALRILVLGGSQAWGEGFPVGSDADIASQIEKNICGGAADCRWEVLNGAVPGANSFTQLQFAKALIENISPDLVVGIFGANDFMFYHGAQGEYERRAKRGKTLVRAADRLFAWRAIEAAGNQTPYRSAIDLLRVDEKMRRIEENLSALKTLCREKNIRLALMDEPGSSPLQIYFQETDNEEMLGIFPTPLYRAVSDAASADGVIYIPGFDAIAPHHGNMLFFDSIHYTRLGAAFMANHIYKKLRPFLEAAEKEIEPKNTH